MEVVPIGARSAEARSLKNHETTPDRESVDALMLHLGIRTSATNSSAPISSKKNRRTRIAVVATKNESDHGEAAISR